MSIFDGLLYNTLAYRVYKNVFLALDGYLQIHTEIK